METKGSFEPKSVSAEAMSALQLGDRIPSPGRHACASFDGASVLKRPAQLKRERLGLAT